MRLGWLVPLALGTISGTNIFGAIAGDKTEVYLPWDTYHFPGLRGGLEPASLKAIFTKKQSQWLLEEKKTKSVVTN